MRGRSWRRLAWASKAYKTGHCGVPFFPPFPLPGQTFAKRFIMETALESALPFNWKPND